MDTTTLASFAVSGISVRTTNEHQQAAKDIPALWERFFAEHIPSKIQDKVSEELYCLYTDYEKDYTKPYTTVLGYKVKNLDALTEGLAGKTVPSKHYKVYTVKGKLAEGIVFKAWTDIWNSPIDRAYTGDFEVYRFDETDPSQAEVDIYIALN